MPAGSQWLAFVVASVVFIQVPGPSLLFTIGRALTVGPRLALLSAAGNALGVLGQVVLVAAGVAPLVAASATVFTVLKLAGAAYVIWLGISAIRHRGQARDALAGGTVVTESAFRALRTGALVGVSNPKTLVFFVAFLPQFVARDAGHPGLQLVLLGAVFSLLAMASDSIWALVAGRARDWFARRPERLDSLGVVGGLMMVCLGGVLAASE